MSNKNRIYVLEVFTKNSQGQYIREIFTFDYHKEALLWLCEQEKYKHSLYIGGYYEANNYYLEPYAYIEKVADSEVEGAVPVNVLRTLKEDVSFWRNN